MRQIDLLHVLVIFAPDHLVVGAPSPVVRVSREELGDRSGRSPRVVVQFNRAGGGGGGGGAAAPATAALSLQIVESPER